MVIHPPTQETIVARSCKGGRSRNWLGPEMTVWKEPKTVGDVKNSGLAFVSS